MIRSIKKRIRKYLSQKSDLVLIEKKIAGLNDNDRRRHKKALSEGYKDEVCHKCKVVFLAFKHFVDCAEARIGKCPMVKPGTKSLLELAEEQLKKGVKNVDD